MKTRFPFARALSLCAAVSLATLAFTPAATHAAPQPGAGGNYGGLLPATFSGNPDDSGILTVVLQESGVASIKFFWQGQAYSGKAVFDADGLVTKNFKKKNTDDGTELELFCALDGMTKSISGVLTDRTASDNSVFSLTGLPPDEGAVAELPPGTYAAFLEPKSGATEPLEDGFLQVSVAKSGSRASRYVGSLPDGTKFSAGSRLRGRKYAHRAGLYPQPGGDGSGGQFLGESDVENTNALRGGVGGSIVSQFRWHKKQNLKKTDSYPGGIDQRLEFESVRYEGDRDPARVFDAEPKSTFNMRMTFTNGNLGTHPTEPSPNPFTVDMKVNFFTAKVQGDNPNKVKVKINTLTGRFNGNFKHPDTGEKVKFRGAFRVSGQVQGRGNFRSRGPQPRDPANARSGSIRMGRLLN